MPAVLRALPTHLIASFWTPSVGAEDGREGGDPGGGGGVLVTSRRAHQLNARRRVVSAKLTCQGDGQDLMFVLLTNQQMFNLKMHRHS